MEASKTVNIHPLSILIGELSSCTDYRAPEKTVYTLVEILFLTFCGTLSGSESYQDIVDFGEMKLVWLRKFLPYNNGIPSHDTIGRVLSILNTKQLEKVLINFSSYGIALPNGCVINIDGKKLSRSATRKEQQTKLKLGGKQAVNMVNVYCSMFDSCLASIQVVDKSSEKKALFDIFELLDLSHCLITLDALYCYRDVVSQIIGADADYLIGLKGNQPKLHLAANVLLAESSKVEIYKEEQQDSHGRLEQRTCSILNISDLDSEILGEYQTVFSKWEKLTSLIKVVSNRTLKANNKTSVETRYYITSQNLTAQQANEIVRGHWKIENNLHWVLDAVFREDDSRKRLGNAAANFSIFRKLAFNKLKNFEDPKTSMKRKMRKCAMSEAYIENILGVS